MAPKTQAELELQDAELDFEPDTSHPDFKDFRMAFTTADLDRQMDDIRSGSTKTVPWEEVKRRSNAVRNR